MPPLCPMWVGGLRSSGSTRGNRAASRASRIGQVMAQSPFGVLQAIHVIGQERTALPPAEHGFPETQPSLMGGILDIPRFLVTMY